MESHRFDRIEEKLDRVLERVSSIDATIASQHVSLTEHIRRTEILENQVAPIKDHVAQLRGIAKFLGASAAIIGLAAAVSEIMSYLKG